MSLVFGLAALILWLLDKLTFKKHMSEEERDAAIEKRAGRFSGAWFTFYLIMATIALPASAFNWGGESFRERLIFFCMAAFILIGAAAIWRWGVPKESNGANDDEREDK